MKGKHRSSFGGERRGAALGGVCSSAWERLSSIQLFSEEEGGWAKSYREKGGGKKESRKPVAGSDRRRRKRAYIFRGKRRTAPSRCHRKGERERPGNLQKRPA